MSDDRQVDGKPVETAISEAIRGHINKARTPEFAARLQRRIIEDEPILRRLKERGD